MKILIIDAGRSEFFWSHVVREMATRGHLVSLVKQTPLDVGRYDVVLHVYLSGSLRDLTNAVGHGTPIVAFSMGTDAITNSFQGTDWSKVRKVLMVNKKHTELLHQQAPATKELTRQVGWFINDKEIAVQTDRPAVVEGSIRLLNAAAGHYYSKGLDNLLQMILSLPEDLRKRIELNVVGDPGEAYLSYFTAFLRDQADFPIIAHGDVPPSKMDSFVNSVNPHATITASQGEASGTTIMESLYKGIPALVQEHPFAVSVENKPSDGKIIDGFFEADAPIKWWLTVGELEKQLRSLVDPSPTAAELHEYAKARWTLKAFTDKVLKQLEGAQNK